MIQIVRNARRVIGARRKVMVYLRRVDVDVNVAGRKANGEVNERMGVLGKHRRVHCLNALWETKIGGRGGDCKLVGPGKEG